jgi:hypothetical protein
MAIPWSRLVLMASLFAVGFCTPAVGDFPRADLTPDTAAQLIMGEQVLT